jgi:hypothetical protein
VKVDEAEDVKNFVDRPQVVHDVVVTQRSVDPVSNTIENCCGGVPIFTVAR